MKIFGRFFIFKTLRCSDIVIFDETNFFIIKKILDKKYHIHIINQRPEIYYINLKILRIFMSEFKCYLIQSNLSYSPLKIIKILKRLYIKSTLLHLNPKICITYIDNSSVFSWLAKNCSNIKFISIQNGLRLSSDANNNPDYYSQYFFCFGNHEKKLFNTLNYRVKKFIPSGSLAGSLFGDFNSSLILYDVLVVSSWRGNIGFSQDVQDTMASMMKMDYLLSEFFTKKNINFAIITRTEKDSIDWFIPEIGKTEEDYFRDIYGKNARIISTNFKKRNIYNLMASSNLIITTLSTAALEAFGHGKKILFCNFHKNDKYHKDFHEDILYSGHLLDKRILFNRIDDLISTPYPVYIKSHKKLMKYYMAYPSSETTYAFIKRKISKLIYDKYK